MTKSLGFLAFARGLLLNCEYYLNKHHQVQLAVRWRAKQQGYETIGQRFVKMKEIFLRGKAGKRKS